MSGDKTYRHEPVLLRETIDALVADPDGLYLDATLGLGGHSEAILRKLSPKGRLLCLDLDPEMVGLAQARWASRSDNVKILHGNFRTVQQILEAEKFFPLSGALFDLGISSLHFDKPERGFSFQHEGPLDMRLSPENPLTAEAIVNRWPEEQLALLFREFGEEPAARTVARAIVTRRQKRLFSTTTDLAEHIGSVVPRTAGRHPATRTFMALRIAVNAELENLTRGLEGVLPFVKSGGRIAVISFHSLEDRIVKTLFSSFASLGKCRPVKGGKGAGAVLPSIEEVERNARSRSAKLRIVEKT
ncbi:MAG TPA: 16S rRNA (cytosine(1402)-N(4))-methyltransferase RsmH [Elusimicrobiota bacterium]|nr:16S rRNA (cytosine(1402)-N(4))-methyltransferase RsmH [Elusimicrobiota bacterium]